MGYWSDYLWIISRMQTQIRENIRRIRELVFSRRVSICWVGMKLQSVSYEGEDRPQSRHSCCILPDYNPKQHYPQRYCDNTCRATERMKESKHTDILYMQRLARPRAGRYCNILGETLYIYLCVYTID